MIEFPGTENAAYLGFHLVNRLIDLLKAKGALTEAEVVALFEQLADDLGRNSGALAQRNVRYVRDTLIPEHKIVK